MKKKKKGSKQELPVLAAPHVSITIRACTLSSELHLKLLLSGSNRRTNAMFLGFSRMPAVRGSDSDTGVCMWVRVYPEERGCGGLPLNGSQVQHSPLAPPEPGFLQGFACKEAICTEVTEFMEHHSVSLLERHHGRVHVSKAVLDGD